MSKMSKILITPLFVFSLLNVTQSQPTTATTTYAFTSFDQSNLGNFSFFRDSYSTKGVIQITPDTISHFDTLVNKSGRVLLNRPFTLYSPARVASFNSTVTVNIYHLNGTLPGEGFAFLVTSALDDAPVGSYGQYLGLTNLSTDGNSSNHFVAIELDTVKESFDPDDDHIGLDINSVRSTVTTSLKPLGIEIAAENIAYTPYTVWVDYDGTARHIYVYMASAGQPKPNTTVLDSPLDLSSHLMQENYFGFAGSTGTRFQLICVLSWELTVENLAYVVSSSKQAWKWFVFIGLPVVTIMVMVGVVLWWFARKKVGIDLNVLGGKLRNLPGTPREFEFNVLKKATNNFDEKMQLGKGAFGIVYRGVIPGENVEVAVKKFSRESIKGQDDFLAELSIINRLRHKNLVRLLGWCHKKGMLLLVYDYMPNGSLDQHLFCTPNLPVLTWDHRYKILTGVASALHYLHNEYDQKVVHRDLKASNVLLDCNFDARLGDFGLARALDADKTSGSEFGGVAGTMGYIAPECFLSGKATSECDVFGFGAVVLEVVSGRRPSSYFSGYEFLSDWVWKLHHEGHILDAVDPRLDHQFDEDDAERLLLLGLACSHPSPEERPKTAAIQQIISRSVSPPVVPLYKPAFVWQSGTGDKGGCATSSMTSRYSTVRSFYASLTV